MCGFVFQKRNSQSDLDRTSIALKSISHRGPDNQSIQSIVEDKVRLGHARLKIIDLSNYANQPMHFDGLYLAFNGEIYNHHSLRVQLESYGYNFTTTSDTEVLLKGIHKFGPDILKKLEGMFAFVCWNTKTKSLFGSLDRVGERPLFYWKMGEEIAVFSEIKAGKELNLKNVSVSKDLLGEYLRLGFSVAPNTIYNNIFKCPPGHYFFFKGGQLDLIKYWSIKSERSTLTKQEVEEDIRVALDKAIEKSLISDVPVGLLLSGGIDSTLIATHASKMTPRIKTFSCAFSVGDRSFKYNEDAIYAQKTAKIIGSEHQQITIDLAKIDIRNTIKDTIQAIDEPIFSANAVSQYLLFQEIHKGGTKVVLDGSGGDELFGGYSRHLHEYKLGKLSQLVPGSIYDLAKKLLPANFSKTHKRLDTISTKSNPARALKWWGVFTPVEMNTFFSAGSNEKNIITLVENLLGAGESLDYATYLQVFDLIIGMGDYMSTITDRVAMAHSIELRSPFLDVNLIEKAFNIRPEQRFFENQTKSILKTSFSNEFLPEFIRAKAKTGWFSPFTHWIKNDLFDDIKDGVNELIEYGICKPDTRQLVKHFDPINAQKLWQLYVLNIWRSHA